MPEGDTIFRTARTLHAWLAGRELTAARSVRAKVPPGRLVGRRVDRVEARAKHLLIHLSSGEVVHTHMRMDGAWHLYRAGDRWRKPGWQARLVLEAGDRLAVCFNAPVVELLNAADLAAHPSISTLGPDVLVDPFDLAEVRRRAATRANEVTVGELLLDQQVASGIGNIYRCEALFACRVNPWTPWSALGDDGLDRLVSTASRLMRANLVPAQGFGRDFGAGPGGGPAVYGRAGRPCRRCGTRVRAELLGNQPREVWWCPRCQAAGGDDNESTIIGG
ncbi:MAG: DNA-formamidopyrimidine glycosylase family protein [Acidimicrobiales bacterium]